VNELRRRVSFLGIESIQKYLRKLTDLEYLGVQGTKLRGQKTMYRLIEDKSFEELEGMGLGVRNGQQVEADVR
jgi:hypothetical protein